jgi:hypothetical protein
MLLEVGVKSGIEEPMQLFVNASDDLGAEDITWPKYPLIDSVQDLQYHLAVGLALGCNILVGGITDLGPSKVNSIIKKAKEEAMTQNNGTLTANKLLSTFANQKKCDLLEDELHVLLDAWYYELTTVMPSRDEYEYEYIFDVPLHTLDKYCADYSDQFDDGIDLITCHGHAGQQQHTYLKLLSLKCTECEQLCCGKKE